MSNGKRIHYPEAPEVMHALYDYLEKRGLEVTMSYFDKYLGYYLDVKFLGKIYIEDTFFRGLVEAPETQYKYKKAILLDNDGGEYSAYKGDYWNTGSKEILADQLVLTHMNDFVEIIDKPTRLDLPEDREVVPLSIKFEKGTVREYNTFVLVEASDEEPTYFTTSSPEDPKVPEDIWDTAYLEQYDFEEVEEILKANLCEHKIYALALDEVEHVGDALKDKVKHWWDYYVTDEHSITYCCSTQGSRLLVYIGTTLEMFGDVDEDEELEALRDKCEEEAFMYSDSDYWGLSVIEDTKSKIHFGSIWMPGDDFDGGINAHAGDEKRERYYEEKFEELREFAQGNYGMVPLIGE